MFLILLILLLISILLQGTIATIPLTVVTLLIMGLLIKEKAFAVAFFAGILIDILTLHSLGSTSLFLLVFVCLVIMYQRKYEINSYPFVIVSSFVGAYLYLVLFGRGSFMQAAVSSIFACLLFTVIGQKFKFKS
jgi:hypothetical protein